ncbi:MAG: helix-turn-helix domain-containing protein, partial [Betaproteobacteria bacterium]|nr:helix-turn-helix domain-containing protein [Betaproteobacteria bacterium]
MPVHRGLQLPGLAGTSRPVKSAVRALELIELFAHERRALRQREIIALLGYPQSSTNFLLRSLIQLGYVSYMRSERHYLPTPRVFGLGSWLRQSAYGPFCGSGPVRSLMEELCSATGKTIGVATQNDIFVQWHQVIDSKHSMNRLAAGSMMPLTYSSYGWMLLSMLPDRDALKTCRMINFREPETRHHVRPEYLLGSLETIRRQGYSYRRNMTIPGGGSIVMRLPPA